MSNADFSRIAIIGAGAIGLYYGGRLAQHGVDVHFLLRRDYELLRQRGLTVQSWQGDFHIPPEKLNAYNDIRQMPKADLVIVTLKTTSNDLAMTLRPPVLHESTPILTLQNGIGVEDDLAARYGAHRILGGIAFVCCNRNDDGVVKHLREGFVRVGSFDIFDRRRPEAIAQLFKASGIECTVLDNLRRGRWEKLVWNIPFNGLGTLLNLTTDELLRYHRQRVESLMHEVIQIATSEGFEFAADLPTRLIRLTEPMGPYKTSMQIDREMGRPLEIEAIIGRPLKIANEQQVPAPELKNLYEGLISLPAPDRAI
jgi:2-dehydropantoate 2-reductase